jgi:outer membrane protein assembly factor BamB
MRISITLLLACLLSTAVAAQQPPEEELLARIRIPAESGRTARRIIAADQLAAERKWPEAVDEYQRVLSEAPDDLIPLDKRHSVQARRLCHLRIAALPPAALKIYRGRVDSQAKRWLDEGKAGRDAKMLRRLVDETFAAAYTDQAIDALGDLAFERGNSGEAEKWWRILALPAGPERLRAKDELVYPDSKIDPARTQAKIVLAHLFAGKSVDAELGAYESAHAHAQGNLAGRSGKYTATLRALAGKPVQFTAPQWMDDWSTFARNSERTGAVHGAPAGAEKPVRLAAPEWSAPLERAAVDKEEGTPARSGYSLSQQSRLFATYPIVVGERVFVAGPRQVAGYETATGHRVFSYDLAADKTLESLSSRLGHETDHDYTATADGGRLYARLGSPWAGPHAGAESFVVCLNIDSKTEDPKRWLVEPPAKPAGAVFEGTPLAFEGRAYAALARSAGGLTRTSAVCLDGDTGSLRWERDICDAPESKDEDRRAQLQLLTRSLDKVVYCSHSGAILALDAGTGRPCWSRRYPSRGTKLGTSATSPRGLAPAIYSDGRLFVAPADYDRILCLDADTGHLLWESTPLEVLHLLGVAKDRLVFTAGIVKPAVPGMTPSMLRAVETSYGNPVWAVTEKASERDVEPYTFGRGLIDGSLVYWPTNRGLFVVRLEDGEVVGSMGPIYGNLAVSGGWFVLGGAESVGAYKK